MAKKLKKAKAVEAADAVVEPGQEQLSDLRHSDALYEMVRRRHGIWCAIDGATSFSNPEKGGVAQLVEDSVQAMERIHKTFEAERQLRLAGDRQ